VLFLLHESVGNAHAQRQFSQSRNSLQFGMRALNVTFPACSAFLRHDKTFKTYFYCTSTF